MLKLELKKMLGSRMVLVLVVAPMIIAVIFAMLVISYESNIQVNVDGSLTKTTGLEAIAQNKRQYESIKGPVTENGMQTALSSYKHFYEVYNVAVTQEFPSDVYYGEMALEDNALSVLRSSIGVYNGTNYTDAMTILDEQAQNAYTLRQEGIYNAVSAQYPNANAAEAAKQIDSRVSTPFYYQYGYGDSAAGDYLVFLFFIILLCSTAIVSPLFAGGYQNGADAIERCTYNGRGKLAVIRMIAALILTAVPAILSIGVYVIIVNNVFGWESLASSIQNALGAGCIAPWTVGQTQIACIIAGAAALLASAMCSALCSAMCKNGVSAMAVAFICALLPLILYIVGKNGALLDWLLCLLPASGASPLGGFYSAIAGRSFLNIGSLSLWTAPATVFFSFVEIFIFAFLAVKIYVRHEDV